MKKKKKIEHLDNCDVEYYLHFVYVPVLSFVQWKNDGETKT